jgi:hypothetical protein
MISGGHEKTVVRRLRVKARKLDSLAAQLRLENLLQTADLHPAWLPASAVVCLRNLRDPLPHTLKLQSRAPTHSLVWQHAITAAVEEKIRSAARPINGEPPADVTAVIFKDQAELLACLASDWANDRLSSRWWWRRSLFKVRDISTLVFDEWLSAPQYIPTALELLSLQRGAEDFARKLSREQAKTLLLAITKCFELPQLQTALAEGFEYLGIVPTVAGPDALKRQGNSSVSTSVALPASLPAPWQHLESVSLNQLPEIELKCLVGVALTIARAPATVRSTVFAHKTLAWIRAAGRDEFVEPRNPVESKDDREVSPNEVLVMGVDPLLRPATASPRVAPAFKNPATQREEASREFSSGPLSSKAPEGSLPAPDLARLEIDLTERARVEPTMPAQQLLPGSATPLTSLQNANACGPSQSTAEMSETFPSPGDEQLVSQPESDLFATDAYRIETKLGGLFYLINLGLFLELYADFTTPAQKGLALSIFDFLKLIGRRLLNDTIGDDPVWELLVQLAGRTELDDTDEEFEPADEWRLPAQWLEAFPDETEFDWSDNGQRLRVRHPAGFMILDVPLREVPAQQLQQELTLYGTSTKRVTKREWLDVSRSESCLEQWLDWIMPYIRVRLNRALGLSDTSDPGPTLCAQKAAIVLTDAHLDIFFTLAEHPLELRLAGLDRDPGWVPAAGRYVRFHYR